MLLQSEQRRASHIINSWCAEGHLALKLLPASPKACHQERTFHCFRRARCRAMESPCALPRIRGAGCVGSLPSRQAVNEPRARDIRNAHRISSCSFSHGWRRVLQRRDRWAQSRGPGHGSGTLPRTLSPLYSPLFQPKSERAVRILAESPLYGVSGSR